MDRLLVILALAAATAGCKKSGGEASDSPPLTLDVLQKLLPDTLAGLPRQLVSPTPEIGQLSAYYQDAGNTKSGHVIYTILSDTSRTVKFYEGRYRERASIDGHTAYTRQYQPNSGPETAEGCLILADRISACVNLAPATIGELAPLFHQLPLAELDKRAR